MRSAFAALLAFAALAASAATTIQHKPVDTYVADKRIRLEATVSDPKGIKLARAYFKTTTQADYLFVPMQAQLTSASTYVAVLPAPAKAASGLQYVFLAVNNGDEITKTEAFMAKRTEGETPSWQMVPGDGQVRVFTELPAAPSPATAFSDSVSMDVAESGARFGAVAGLYGGQASSAAAATTSTTGTPTTVSATAAGGGLGTGALIGGLAIAGAAAAAGGGGGGGGGDSGSTSYAGSWSGTNTASMNVTCTGTSATCSLSMPWSGTVSSANVFTGSYGNTSATCTSPGFTPVAESLATAAPLSFTIASNGSATVTPAVNQTISAGGATVSVNCSALTAQFVASPRGVSGTQPCSATYSYPGLNCNMSWQFNFTGH